MKIIVVDRNYHPCGNQDKPEWWVMADSAMSNTGKLFYLPETFMGNVAVSLSGVLKINRLGKHIEKKFAPKYYSEYAPALNFRLIDLENKLKQERHDPSESRNFDKALIVGDFTTVKDITPLKLYINKDEVCEFSFENLVIDADEIISRVSTLHTLKIGDIIVPALSGSFILKEGDILDVRQGEEQGFTVRVK